FWNKGVLIIGANRASIFLHLIPLFSSIWAIFILDEKFSMYHTFGILFIVIGIILANFKVNL
ncbi:MAG: EamA family transporter, partial [Candidatus Poribacteria bacterium]|nr:EamA family transporter [Candidatus Poribacteria bacterium]